MSKVFIAFDLLEVQLRVRASARLLANRLRVNAPLCFNELMWPFKRRGVRVYVPPPPSPDAAAGIAALRAEPGPSPWYLTGAVISDGPRALRWRSAGDPVPLTGKSLLVDTQDRAFAVADFQCYVRPLGARQLLVWHAEEHGEGPTLRRDIRLRLLDVGAFQTPIDVAAACAGLGRSSPFFAASGEVATAVLSTALDDGVQAVTLPAPFRDAGELLLPVHSTAGGRREDHFNEMHLRLWILDPAAGRLEIVPQDWFNHGAYDYGYQWVTRFARLPHSKDIVGEGIRLGIFRLDPTMRQVGEWLVENIFYQAEPAH